MCLLKSFIIFAVAIEAVLGSPLEFYEGSSCTFPISKKGICTPTASCPYVMKLINKYGNHSLPSCGWNRSTEMVCCPTRKSVQACEKYRRIPIKSQSQRSSELIPFIEGGRNASVAEYPHMAALGFYNKARKMYQFNCGGSLISEKYVITGAHCIVNLNENELKIVRMGVIDVPAEVETVDPVIDYKVKNTLVYPRYKRRKHINDIALVELEKNVEFKLEIRPACLYSSNQEPSEYEVSGWGDLKLDGDRSPILQKSYLKFVSRETCSKKYLPYGKIIDKTVICANDDTNDTCPGDSCGPLQIREADIFTIVGITSPGDGCGGSIPGIYTRVYSYLNWIENIVWP